MGEDSSLNYEVVEINEEQDVVLCRQICREWAKNIGFNLVDQTRITTSASELARNIHDYAGNGEVIIEQVDDGNRRGIKITFKDKGPGIPDVEKAMNEGYTTRGSMGMGLPGSKKLMDDFSIISKPNEGTTVIIWKWLPY